MKKQLLLFPLLGLLLGSCGTTDTTSSLSGTDTTSSFSSVEDTCSNTYDYDHLVPMKPIIYFYPEEEMNLKVTYVQDERLLTTYPKYEDGWNIHLKEDGTFTLKGSEREYYALYFDEIGNYETDWSEGFYVTKENAISFLEEKMDYIGYTNRETDEFIMYWLPVLENNEKSLIYFEQTEERNEECPLEFSLEPDTTIRTLMHIKKVDEETPIKEQTLTHYERDGFTVTEWGGVEY